MKKNLLAFMFFVPFVAALVSFAPPELTKSLPAGNEVVTTEEPGDKMSRKEMNKALIEAAEEMKGEKLTLKEKIGLKIFGKKISTIHKGNNADAGAAGGKSQVVALVLGILLGGLGIHRFYLGYTWQGVVQLLTGGGCGIWALIDIIRIATGDLQPKDGTYEKTL